MQQDGPILALTGYDLWLIEILALYRYAKRHSDYTRCKVLHV